MFQKVFLRVEAVLSLDWVKSSNKDLTTILEEIENLGIESINFSRGNHVLVGSLDQLVRIREHLFGREEHSPPGRKKPEWQDNYYAEMHAEPQRNDLSTKNPFSVDREREVSNAVDVDWTAKTNKDRPNFGKEPANYEPVNHEPVNHELVNHEPVKQRRFSKELMVDNDIWEYIENKKADELKDLETMFAAALSKAEDDSGVLKIAITPRSNDTTSEEVGIMHETLVGLYQETFMKCVIEKHEVHFSDEEAELMLEYISEKFPVVFAKRCVYNDDFLFIGPPRMAREARQQFQVLAQRLKKGQLKSKMDNRAVLDDYARSRGRFSGYEDRYNYHEDDLYQESYTNDFQNVHNENVVKEEYRNEPFMENEGRAVVSPGGDPADMLNNELSNEEDERTVEAEKPRLIPWKGFDLPAADWNRRDKNNYVKPAEDVMPQFGFSSLIYQRQNNEENGVARNASSDVEDDDWKMEFPTKKLGIKKDTDDDWKRKFPTKNLGIEKDKEVDELRHESPDRKLERSPEPRSISDSTHNAEAVTGGATSLHDDDKLENDEPGIESPKAAKSLDDVSDRNKKGKTEDDGPVLKKDPPSARIDANSITYRPLDPVFAHHLREETASKNFEEFISNSASEKTGSTDSLEKKPQKKKKKSSDSGPKVRIIKQAVPGFPGDDAPKEVLSELKAVSEPKATGESLNSNSATGMATTCRAAKSSHREVLGAPSRVVGDLERRELREVFRTQKRGLTKMQFDSSSSEDDDEVAGMGWEGKGDKMTHQMIEELMSRGDEASQKLLQSLLEQTANTAGGKEAPVDNGRIENNAADEAGGLKLKADVPAAEKPAAAVSGIG